MVAAHPDARGLTTLERLACDCWLDALKCCLFGLGWCRLSPACGGGNLVTYFVPALVPGRAEGEEDCAYMTC